MFPIFSESRPIQELVCTMQNYISKKGVTCSQAYHEHIVYTRIQIQLHPIPNPTINQNYIIHLCKIERTAMFMTLSIFPDRKNSSLERNQTQFSLPVNWAEPFCTELVLIFSNICPRHSIFYN